VFQNPDDQIFNKDVITEIEYMPRYFKLPEKEIRRRVERAVYLTSIEKYLKKNPFDIPYSIRKFVSIAAVLATETDYVIFDEPTAGQDLYGIQVLSKLMAVLESEGRTVITITHDMDFVADNFKRVVAMANKHIIADGDMRDIFWNESVVTESRIKKPQIGELAKDLNLPGNILFGNEFVEALKAKK
ncbi:MAG TPA: ABC transporter ATP-binding protein, partial [Negativicutes bacterium]|nr:ABC transporter ATP-binding protein [Negativicutes bacterium]